MTESPVTITAAPATDLSLRARRLYGLRRAAQIGWTRNAHVHELLTSLASDGLVQFLGIERRSGPKQRGSRAAKVFAGSYWEITESGRVEMRALIEAGVECPDPIYENPTWQPTDVAESTRVDAGVYSVKLRNGASATIAKSDKLKGTATSIGWTWRDRSSEVSGIPTKREAIESFRKFRG